MARPWSALKDWCCRLPPPGRMRRWPRWTISTGFDARPRSRQECKIAVAGEHLERGLVTTKPTKGYPHGSRIERSKVPEVTLVFWIIKILATTLGETGGDAVSMSLNLGYAVSSFIFIGIFAVAVVAQIAAKKFHPFLYWLVVIATTTAGTTMADFADRSLGIGYPGGASLLFVLLMASLAVWYWSAGSISVNTVSTPKIETFYWVAILFSQTLGTALGDWMADTNGSATKAARSCSPPAWR